MTISLHATTTLLEEIAGLGTPACECRHRDRPGGRCGCRAQVRVTVVCAAEGCDCAAGVYLICRECLSVWRRNARRDGYRLRVKPL